MNALLTRSKNVTLAAALGLLLSLGAMVAAASPAAAATTAANGTFRLCNVSADYSAQATLFQNGGGVGTREINPGTCTSVGLDSSLHSYNVTIRGLWANSPSLTTTSYSIPSGRSIDFHTGGTFNSPQFTPLVY